MSTRAKVVALPRRARTAMPSLPVESSPVSGARAGWAAEGMEPRTHIDVSIVSDSQLLREGLVALLANYVGVRLIGGYSGAAAPQAPPNPPEHVVLLDGGLGCEATVAWIAFWRGRTPSACVVVVEMESDVETIVACIEAGVSGYALRGASAGEIAEAISHALRGMARCSPEVTARLFARLAAYRAAQTPAPVVGPLTERELEVLRYIAADYSNLDIAKALTIEVYTVKHHVHNILEKLRLRHRWDAARYAAEQGWIEGDIVRG